jgi:hypothetical protein
MTKQKRKHRKQIEPLEAIKRLLILLLAKQGAASDEIGRALEVDSSTIRHIVSFRAKKSIRN